VISWLTWRILSGLPTDVPPNFMTFIWYYFWGWQRYGLMN